MYLYPLNLNLRRRICTVFGGGRVACRKVRGLIAVNAQIRIISPALVPDLVKMEKSGAVEWIERCYHPGDVGSSILVIAATDSSDVQEQIRLEAEQLGVLCNVADQPEKSSFHVPAHFRRGDILVSVSTGGKSPLLAAELCQLIEQQFDSGYLVAVSFLGQLRKKVLANDDDAEAHGQMFKKMMENGIVEQIKTGKWDKVRALLNSYLPADLDGEVLINSFLKENDLRDF